MLPLSESMLSSSNVGLIGDFALFMSRQFRIGWAPYWSLANPGDSFVMSKVKEAATDVFIERHESLPGKIYFYFFGKSYYSMISAQFFCSELGNPKLA